MADGMGPNVTQVPSGSEDQVPGGHTAAPEETAPEETAPEETAPEETAPAGREAGPLAQWAGEPGAWIVGGLLRGLAGGLAELAQAEEMILDLLPCHLEVEFQLQYLTWALCHKGGYTWEYVEGQGYTWRLFQLAVPPESGEG